ncbi:hypothetical protein BJ508DRAFT_151137 [Ascobolus immersus RN42]|uniref:Uncharacterized protein n=1 Tax=Ascobolus immersus RN42 TaxID=1160509 RepID=A0A3N4I2P4_ASCIM|nr:hypothetical protein BJ508DRAFT_151137 [Ascobolus immersus RN42]
MLLLDTASLVKRNSTNTVSLDSSSSPHLVFFFFSHYLTLSFAMLFPRVSHISYPSPCLSPFCFLLEFFTPCWLSLLWCCLTGIENVLHLQSISRGFTLPLSLSLSLSLIRVFLLYLFQFVVVGSKKNVLHCIAILGGL